MQRSRDRLMRRKSRDSFRPRSLSTQKVSRREALFWKMVLLLTIALLAFLFTTIQGWLFPLD